MMPVSSDAGPLTQMRRCSQKMKLIGPAKNRQTNSHLPMGIAPSSVKNHISVKKSQIPEVGIPRQLQPLSFLKTPIRHSRSSCLAMVCRCISDVPS